MLERIKAETQAKILKEIQSKRCHHGMLYEYCGYCNRIDYETTVKVPIPLKNKITGETLLKDDGTPRVMFLERLVTRYHILRYR